MTTILLKRGTAEQVASATVLAGEPVFSLTDGKLYIGDGTTKVLINPTYKSSVNYDAGNGAGELPILGADGKLNSSVIPSVAITETYVVASEEAMLALDANVGDVAVRTDIHQTFILQTADASVLAHWVMLETPIDTVLSVNGKVGVVVLEAVDIAMGAYAVVTDSVLGITATTTVNEAVHAIDTEIVSVRARVLALETTIDGGLLS